MIKTKCNCECVWKVHPWKEGRQSSWNFPSWHRSWHRARSVQRLLSPPGKPLWCVSPFFLPLSLTLVLICILVPLRKDGAHVGSTSLRLACLFLFFTGRVGYALSHEIRWMWNGARRVHPEEGRRKRSYLRFVKHDADQKTARKVLITAKAVNKYTFLNAGGSRLNDRRNFFSWPI